MTPVIGSRRGAAFVVALAVALAATACKRPAPPPAGAAAGGPLASEPAAPALTAEALSPVIHERALPGELPDAVVVNLARPAAPDGAVGNGSVGTVVTFTPAVKAIATWESASTLVVKPQEPLAHDTAYTVAVEEVETFQGVLAPAKPWTHAFRTPAFGLVRAGLAKAAGSRVELHLAFSGPVKPEAVARHLSWQIAGQPLDGVRLSTTDRPGVVAASFTDRRAVAGARIVASLRAGAPARERGVVAPAGEVEVTLPTGAPVTVRSVRLGEADAGFYVDVVCDDRAAGGERWYWDRDGHDSHRISTRCVLSAEEAASSVRFTPPVRYSISPGPGGFRIFGDFRRGPLALAIDAGALTEDGGSLAETVEETFTVPARRSSVAFATSGRYLPRSAWRSLPVTHVNVDEVKLTVRHVPPENLVFWLSDDEDEKASARTSDAILTRTLPLGGAPDEQATTWIDVGSLLPATTQGILELRLESRGAAATARLLLTGMNLVAKRSAAGKEAWQQEVRVWALDMDSTDLLSGAEVSLVRKSGKVLGRCTTSGAKGCSLAVSRDDVDDEPPFALLARKGDDLTYVRWADLETDTSEADVAGEAYGGDAAYRAAVWTERGVYRPGDVAHVAAVVRDREHQAPPAGMPVELLVVDPRQQIARRLVLRTNEAGLVTADLPFGAYADTGRYEVAVAVAERRVGSRTFSVEEFVPERMKVQAAAERPAYLLGDAAGVAVEARYLFGGSAESSPVELTCTLEPSTFRPSARNAQFRYGPRPGRAAPRPLALGVAKGALDAQGRATLACPAPEGAFAGPARVLASAAVFEGGSGRSSVAQAAAAVHPARHYVGLQAAARKAEPGKPVPVSGVVVDWTGAPAPAVAREATVELLRLEPEYGWWWDEEEGGERFERHLRPVSEGSQRVPVTDGAFQATVTPREGAVGYVVRARAGEAVLAEVEVPGDARGFWWGEPGSRAERTPRPLRPGAIALELPGLVKVGEKARVKADLPFRGRALVTVETDRVLSAEWREVEAGPAAFDVAVETFAPNVYVSVLLVKDPHLESKEAFLPDRAFGVASAPVEPARFTAPLALEVPRELRSSSTLRVKLDAGPVEGPTWAVVAAVDEGILQLTRMKSPDPLAEIFAKRALGVKTYETIGWTLLLPPQGPTRRTGGDEGEGAAGRVQPVKPVALWSGPVQVGADGKVTVELQVPQYRGQLRVMAVTVGPRRMGRASADVVVKDPIVLSTTLPRFVTQDDELRIPVFLTNLSGAPQEVKVSLSAEPLPVPGMTPAASPPPPLVFLGKSEGSARLEDGRSTTLVFQVRAAMGVGAAKLRVTARAGGHESREELDVPFLAAGPRERIAKRIEVGDGPLDLRPHLAGWVPTTERTNVWLTANPYGESFDHLKFLIHYPYGCVEQTTSTTRPLLFAATLIENVDPAFTAGGKIEAMVQAGIQRLLSMQTPSGGLAYWPGGTEPSPWGTAYATHLLLDAQAQGYAVPKDRLDEILRWAEAEVGRLERGTREREEWYGSGEAYLHYVLAVAGKGHKARVQKLVDMLPSVSGSGEVAERRYMLQAALWLAGDRRYEAELRNPDAGAIRDDRSNSWSFYSDRRRRGFMLSTFQDLFGNDPAGEPLAQRVADALRGPSPRYSTQELVWGVTGLGKRVGAVARDFTAGKLVADGKTIAPQPTRAKTADRTWSLARASEYGALAIEGTRGSKVYALLSSEGVRVQPSARTGGDGLSLTRTWRTAAGDPLDPRGQATPLAGLLLVELTLRNRTGARVQNVVLTDRIPAGFEIENPRLGRGQAVAGVDPEDLWKPDHLDVRDHVLAVFGALGPGEEKKVVYAVRAVTAGKFTLPPAEAEAMYDPSIWAREGGGTVEITAPWKDGLL